MEAFLKTFAVGMPIVLSPQNLLILLIGTIWGMIFGSIPGLTATMGVALALPLTYGMSPYTALSLLSAIYVGAISGGFISAGLINIPGTPSSIATTFDAHPMVKKGQAPLAMGISLMSSFFGGLTAVFLMIVATYSLAQIALKFGPFEYLALGILAFAGCIGMFEGGILLNSLSIVLGLLISTIGADPLTGVKRLTFGIDSMIAGIDILPLLIGLFGISEVFVAIESKTKFVVPPETKKMKMGFQILRDSIRTIFSQPINFIRSLVIGFIIGVFPGVGGATSSVLAYGVAKSYSKHPEKFGTGIPDGVIASETANNATIAGAIVPLLSLGIPGDLVTAMMIGGFMIHGMIPGPMLFKENPSSVYTVFSAQILSNIIMVVLGILLMRFFISALSIRSYYLYPIITVAMIIGSYGLYNRVFDIWVALFFGFLGYVLRKINFPLVPLITAFILGPIVEKSLRQALSLSQGSLVPLFTRPISLTLIVLAVFLFALGLYINTYVSKRARA